MFRKVFSLKLDEVGVAMNNSKSKVFVFRLVDDLTPEKDLKTSFLTIGSPQVAQFSQVPQVFQQIQTIAYIERESLISAWYSSLESEMGVTWTVGSDGGY